MLFERSGFHSFRRVLTGVLAAAATVVVPVPAAGADEVLVVTGTGDASDRNLDDAVCDVSATAGLQCTLRAAIEEANDTPGADAIVFDIQSAAAVKTITPATPLPAITETLTIDGYSQAGASANTLATGDDAVLKIQLNGTNAGTDAVGLEVDADDSVIKGLVINRFSGTGVLIGGSNGRLVGSFVGTNPAGDLARPNEFGVLMFGPDVTVGGTGRAARNLISGNAQIGVRAANSQAAGSRVQGSYIGTDHTGKVALPNGGDGVDVNSTPNVRIGGTANGAGNPISGNAAKGLDISSCQNCRVQRNLVGTNAAGTAPLGNGTSGIDVFGSTGAVVGGTTASARNVISGNGANGMRVGIGVVVQGNFIGTDATGTAAMGNRESGVALLGSGNLIGGSVTGARNVISANLEHGVVFDFPEGAHDNVIQGNLIGTKADGTGDLGNAVQGIELLSGDNVIGGPGAAANVISGNDANGIRIASGFSDGNQVTGNVIGANGLAGVRVEFGPQGGVVGNVIFGNGTQGVRVSPTAPGVPVLTNQIFGNGTLGIDLSGGTQNAAGVTSNDTDDPDTGANHLQNFPVLSLAFRNGTTGMTTVVGSLNSLPSTEFTIQLFLVAADASNHGEALVFLQQKNATTSSSGDIGFSFSVAGLSPGQQLTATATNVGSAETSEFSLNVTVVPAP